MRAHSTNELWIEEINIFVHTLNIVALWINRNEHHLDRKLTVDGLQLAINLIEVCHRCGTYIRTIGITQKHECPLRLK